MKEKPHSRPNKTPEEANAIYQTILEDALAGYWEWNLRDNTERVSATFKAMLGYENEKILEEPGGWKKIIFSEDLPKIEQAVEDHIREKGKMPFQQEVRYRHSNGHAVWILCTGRVVEWDPSGAPAQIVGCHIDISRQKKVEEDLRISQTRFKGAFDYSAIGMGLVSIDGHWLRVNSQLSNLLGYSRQELLGKTFQELTHPDDLDLDLTYVQKVLDGEIKTYQMEKRYFHRNGQIIWVLLSVSLVKDAEDMPLYFVSQIQDITQRKQAEKALLDVNAELMQKNSELLKTKTELESLTSKLQKQNTQLGDFAHITSHNLRAPVSNLRSLLMMHNTLKDPVEKEGIFKKFEAVIHHLSDTLGDLVESLEITEKQDVKRSNIQFEKTLQKVLDILSAQIIETQAEIHYDFSNAPAIHYNRSYLESILMHLISNAIQYRSPDRTPMVHIKSWKDGRELKLSVSDNGLGINMKRQGHKLFGLHKTFHRNENAKGVGLFMTRARVESQGGEITASSEEGEGSTFTVTFNKET